MAYETKFMNTHWDNGRFNNYNINFQKPYNKDTLQFLNFCFNQGLLQTIYRSMKNEYQDNSLMLQLFYFLIEAWQEKMQKMQKEYNK